MYRRWPWSSTLHAWLIVCGVSATLLAAATAARADVGVKNASGACHFIADAAEEALRAEQYALARSGFTKAIDWTRQNCAVPIDNTYLWMNYKGRAEASARLGDPVAAAQDIAQLTQSSTFQHKLGAADYDWIMQALEAAIEAQPESAAFYGARGAMYDAASFNYSMNNNVDQAAFYALLALNDRDSQVAYARSDGERAAALADRHLLHKNLNNRQLALNDITRAIELDPLADHYWRRALFRMDSGDTASFLDALEDVSMAIELEPERYWYHKLRTEIYQTMGNTDGAIDSLTEALAAVPPDNHLRSTYLTDRAGLLKQKGRLEEAANDYAALIEIRPNNAGWRFERMVLLLQQGLDEAAETERREIASLDGSLLRDRNNLCTLSAAYERRHAATGRSARRDDMLRAWNQGQIVALVPLRHVVGNQDAKTAKAWDAMTEFVRTAQPVDDADTKSLDAIPAYTGSKSDQLRQALQFIDDQLAVAKDAADRSNGEQAGAVLVVSAFGHMAEALNRMGVSDLNARFGDSIARFGPPSGLPCELWIEPMLTTLSGADREAVVSAWSEAKSAFRTLTGR